MRRLFIAAVGVVALCFGAAILLDVVSLSTPRADRWAVIFSFAGIMFSIGVLSASKDTNSSRAAALVDDVALERSLRLVPSAPGSLRSTSSRRAVAPDDEAASAIPVDSIPPRPPELGTMPEQAPVEPVAERPVPSSVNLDSYSDGDLITTVKNGERSVIAQMMTRGQLTTSGPLSEQDIAMMIFLACTSDDLLVDLRERKASAQPVPAPTAHSPGPAHQAPSARSLAG